MSRQKFCFSAIRFAPMIVSLFSVTLALAEAPTPVVVIKGERSAATAYQNKVKTQLNALLKSVSFPDGKNYKVRAEIGESDYKIIFSSSEVGKFHFLEFYDHWRE